ncbi:hypothetical protein J6590_100459, partial [Homalodisca vitripennis]
INMVCNKCGLDFSCADEVAKCLECKLEYHAGCCRIRTAAKLARLIAAKTVWRCDACASDAMSVSSRSDTEDLSIVDLLKNIQLEMGRNIKANSENFADLKKTTESIELSW